MTTYADLNTSQIAALQLVFNVLSAHHAPPFAAEFLQEFRVQILAAVLHEGLRIDGLFLQVSQE
ncbi:hypothetical protein OU994_17765 [Pseudoduganella sp. SL102]|uniref:hypothetical protein n=1 Tax=Pseudoduganella sp. SL102 TaxID=2995154 RepID=UPI00248C40BE|nr:hypothetical protein [Pseudoduganella sp. SL102]WBS00171.1 hypothetical protein OU994_17765 [Pseudoduganella sp. SL102]